MLLDLSIQHSITLETSPAQVWDALINPAKIKTYLFGTETISDWKEGSSIVFQGEWEGQTYRDHGTIKRFVPEQIFEYDYWSNFSGIENIPENYALITFEITPAENATLLTITQKGFANKQAQEHSNANWQSVLEGIAKVV